MLDGFECYWKALRFRIQMRVEELLGLEGLIVRRRRTSINNGKLSYRTQGRCLVEHSYTKGAFLEVRERYIGKL
ncbi:hypothetical protein FORC22_4772 (plasmid) [Vibrio parahaemolyticus]|nr:hypothetical protein FORC22_4772 [Vibrio parahaemolyticus]